MVTQGSIVRGQTHRATLPPRPETSSLQHNEVHKQGQIDIKDKNLAQGPAFKQEEDTKTHFRILSLDGGGVKGIMPAIFLEQLELELQAEVKRWQKKEQWRGGTLETMKKSLAKELGRQVSDLPSIGGDTKKLRIADFFDLVAGTSTGGLIAAFLTTRDQTNSEIRPAGALVDLYKTLATDIFPTDHYEKRKDSLTARHCLWGLFRSGYLYDVRPLERKLQEVLQDAKAYATVKPCVIPTLSFDTNMPQIWETGIPRGRIVTGETEPHSDRHGLKNTEMWKVCRATSAAPTYFKPATVIRRVPLPPSEEAAEPAVEYITERYLDGGLFANDPIFFAYRWPYSNRDQAFSELKIPDTFRPERGSIMVLSLGCGEAVVAKDPRTVNPEKWSIKDWMMNTPDLISRAMSGTGHAPDLAFFFPYLTARRMPYYLRMQPKIVADLAPMDRAASLEELEKAAEKYLFRTCGHQGYPSSASYPVEGDGKPRAPLTNHLAESYTGDRENQAFILESLVKETNGQTLARFAQLLAREWVLRRLRGANFGVNVQDPDETFPNFGRAL